MKILIVYPTKLSPSGIPIKYRKSFLPPLSLAILNRLTPKRHSVKFINEFVENIDFSIDFDLVAISAMTNQVTRSYQIASIYKKRGIPVILGGVHATVHPEDALKHLESIVLGEVTQELWEEILTDAEKRELKNQYKLPQLPDLTKTILSKWDNINLGIYPHRMGSKIPMMPIFTSRGCPFDCDFCSVTKFFGRSYRIKPVEALLKEIDMHNSTDYFFVDDNLTAIPDYSRELFSALSGRNIRWVSQTSTMILKNPDLIEKAKKAGCWSMFIGLESISQQSLKSTNKQFNKPEQYTELFERLRRAKIAVIPSFIFGFDEDTEEVFEETLRFLNNSRIGFCSLFILTPFPGTNLYNKMEAEGRIFTKNWALYDATHVVFKPNNLSVKELHDNYWRMLKEFYSWKNYFMHNYNTLYLEKDILTLFMNNFFYEFLFRKQIKIGEHPFSQGLLPVK